MRNIIKMVVTVLVTTATWISCSDNTELGLPSKKGSAPSEPKVLNVRNTNGGAVIHYQIPTEDDLLYVSATYEINGKEYVAKASHFVDSLVVEGFGEQKEYIVKLKSVDKDRNESAFVDVKINPKKSLVESIYESLEVREAFGGISLTWNNPTESNVVIGVSLKDSIGDWTDLEYFYSSLRNGRGVVRGLDSIPQDFRIVVRDRWDNYSSQKECKLKPLYEEQADPSLFRTVERLVNDCTPHGSGAIPKMWDGNTAFSNSFFTIMQTGEYGQYFVTFDMGQMVKWSRFKLWNALPDAKWYYGMANVKSYAIYGCTEITEQMRETGSLDDWTLLFDGEHFKPSGDGPVTNEDLQYAKDGDEHEIYLDAPAVRYIRIHMKDSWGLSIQKLIAELKIWGQVQK